MRKQRATPMRLIDVVAGILLFSIAAASFAREEEPVTPERARANFARLIVFGPDDVRASGALRAGQGRAR